MHGDQKTTAEYTQLGDASLAPCGSSALQRRCRRVTEQALRYGRDYFFGDLVSVYTGATTVTRKIRVDSVELKR
jgi:hypothetical protein